MAMLLTVTEHPLASVMVTEYVNGNALLMLAVVRAGVVFHA
jgi:hypothetical protein